MPASHAGSHLQNCVAVQSVKNWLRTFQCHLVRRSVQRLLQSLPCCRLVQSDAVHRVGQASCRGGAGLVVLVDTQKCEHLVATVCQHDVALQTEQQ